jgi:hypothetical protein
MRDGYWDDIEDPPNHLDGDYLVPSDGLGLVTLGGDYAYEFNLIGPEATAERFRLSFLMGAGLGIGIITGYIDRWRPDNEGNPSYKRYLDEDNPDDQQGIPRVFPMVDIQSGLRFTFGERTTVRLEGGLHTMLFYGTSIGVVF